MHITTIQPRRLRTALRGPTFGDPETHEKKQNTYFSFVTNSHQQEKNHAAS